MPERREESALLADVFHDPRFVDPGYLQWLYDQNPDGVAIVGHVDADGRGLAHYSLVPQRWRSDAGSRQLGITVNAAVRAGAQRKGVFSDLARQVYKDSAAAGIEGTITVANANSTPPFLNKLGFELIRPLPVVITPPRTRGRTVQSLTAAELLSDDKQLEDLAVDFDAINPRGWLRDWSVDSLRWRLQSPIGNYFVHVADDVWGVSARTHVARVPVTAILKLVPRAGNEQANGASIVAAACRSCRTPIAIYTGFNSHVSVSGAPLPRSLLPSPLNLLVRGFSDKFDVHEPFQIDTYEFFEADHY